MNAPWAGRWSRELLLPFAVTRLALGAVALVSWSTRREGGPCDPCSVSTQPLLDALSRWDGAQYLSIARDGYSFDPGRQSNAAFLPLYPLLMRVGGALVPGGGDDSLLWAGVLISNVALLVALGCLAALVRPEHGDQTASRSVLYVLVFPTSFYLSAVYAESLFLALAIGAVLCARRERWVQAGALAALAAVTRPFGVLLIVPLAAELLGASRRASSTVRWHDAVSLGLPVVSFLAWQSYLYQLSGDPLAGLAAQAAYARHPAPPWEAIVALFGPGAYGNWWLVLVTLVIMTVLTIVSWRVLRPGLALYGTAVLLASTASGTLASFMRYALALFPAFIVLARAGSSRPVHLAYVVISSCLAALLMGMFAQWYWVG